MTTIIGGKIITPIRYLENSVISYEGKKITYSGKYREDNCYGEVIDVRGLYVAPGFIDIHTHGGFGYDFITNNSEAILSATRKSAKYGVTAVIPTMNGMQEPTEEEWSILDAFSNAMSINKNTTGAELLGVHFEGPFCGKDYALTEEPVTPNAEKYNKLLDRAQCLKRWTIAPEISGTLPLIREARKRGIKVSIGHSAATFDQVNSAFEAGANQVTHLYSGMNGVYRVNGMRKPGLLETAFIIKDLYSEVICNGVHICPEMLNMIYKIKGSDYFCIVSDSHYRSLDEDTNYDSLERVRYIKRPNGYALDSAMPYNEMIRLLVNRANIPLIEAIRMGTITPARAMGISNRKGLLAEGYDADIVAFDENINIKLVIARGEVLYNFL